MNKTFSRVAVVSGAALAAVGSAHAAIDTTAALAGIGEAQTAVLAVLAGLITMSIAVWGVTKLWRMFRG